MEYGSLFISITFNYSYVLELNITAESSHILKTVTQPGLGTIVNLNAEDIQLQSKKEPFGLILHLMKYKLT